MFARSHFQDRKTNGQAETEAQQAEAGVLKIIRPRWGQQGRIRIFGSGVLNSISRDAATAGLTNMLIREFDGDLKAGVIS